MKHFRILYTYPTRFVALLLCLLLVSTPALSTTSKEKDTSSHKMVKINFPDIDINVLIKLISEMTGKNFIVDQAVKGKVTIICPDEISLDDAYRVFESVLEVHGYATVPSGAVIKIVPAVEARSKSIPTVVRDEKSKHQADDKFVTRIIHLDYANPDDIKRFITPLVSKTSMVMADDNSNLLVITDALANINRLLEIIKAVDVPSEDEELEIIPLKYASAASIGKSIGQLFTQARTVRRRSRSSRTSSSTTVKIIPDERTNSLIVFAPREDIEKLRNLLAQLDVEVSSEGGNIHVYYLQHADAEELVKVLTNLPTKKTSKTEDNSKVVRQNPADTKNKNAPTEEKNLSAVELSDDIKITADPDTNALIITSSKEEYKLLEQVIKQLDIPRRMVYLEALIMEVSIDKQFEIGAEWGGLGSFHDETGTLGSGFTNNNFGLVGGIDKGIAGMSSGATLGILKKGVEIGGTYFPNLGAVVNTYQKDSDINIIATPQILTTDNKEANITVGENVPYITSKNTSSTGSTQDYTNYEYKDVGTTLKITPQINQANLLRLDIEVEVTRLKSEAGVTTPTTYKRSAATSVVVHNEDIVVIGGMIGQDETSGDYKVPLLGDIPVLGWLFKTHESSGKKTNMFIFIAPKIVDSSPQLTDIYYKKRDKMEEVKKGKGEVPDQILSTKKSQKHAYLLLDQGFAKLQDKEYKAAEKYFHQALKNAPKDPHALINLAAVQEQQGENEEAITTYQQILDLANTTDDLLLKTARTRLRRLKWDAMKTGLQKKSAKQEKKDTSENVVEPLEKMPATKSKEPAPGSDEAVLQEAQKGPAAQTKTSEKN